MENKPQPDIEYAPPSLQDGLVDRYIDRRVCARCYGELNKRFAPNRMWAVFCPRCQEAWNYTTVSRKYAETLGQQAIADRRQALENFKDLFPNPHQGKSDEALLHELGY